MTPVAASFHDQANSCRALGSPFMASLLDGLADGLQADNPVAARVLDWPGDVSGRGASVPLRLAGGLHRLVLGGDDPLLAAAYARAGAGQPARAQPLPAAKAKALTDAALAAIRRNEAFFLRWLDSAPQTNEVRRSAALIAAGHWLAARFDLPLVLSELGSSAGLNLLWDHYALSASGRSFGPADPVLTLTPDWDGPLPTGATPVIQARAGVDLNPLDPVGDRLRLLSYLWPDQPDRLARTATALDLAARLRPRVDKGDAVEWLEDRLRIRHDGALHLIFHTIAWQYFPQAAQDRGAALLDQAGAATTPTAPLAHLAMEADTVPGTAALTLRLWPSGDTHQLGRVDFHGRSVIWTAS